MPGHESTPEAHLGEPPRTPRALLRHRHDYPERRERGLLRLPRVRVEHRDRGEVRDRQEVGDLELLGVGVCVAHRGNGVERRRRHNVLRRQARDWDRTWGEDRREPIPFPPCRVKIVVEGIELIGDQLRCRSGH
jgi:hypothetical protein